MSLTLLLFTTLVANTYASVTLQETSSVQITSLGSNRPIYYDTIGKVQLIHDEWKLLMYYNLSTYWSGVQKFENYLQDISYLCKSLEPKYCETTIRQLSHELDLLQYYNNILLAPHNHLLGRNKRGLIDGVGYVANSLFGVLDQRFADQYQKDIQNVQKNEDYLLQLVRNQTSIVEIENEILKKNEDNIGQQFTLINNFMNDTDVRLAKIESGIEIAMATSFFTSASLAAHLLLKNLKNIQETLLNTLLDIYKGRMDVHLLTPVNLIQQLTIISGRLPKTLTLPVDNIQDEIKDIYKLIYVKARVTDNYFMYELHIPLASDEDFVIHQVIPLPMKNLQKEAEATAVPVSFKYIAVNLEKNTYIRLNDKELNRCIQRRTDNLVCIMNLPIFSLQNENAPCEAKLLGHQSTLPCITENTKYCLHLQLYKDPKDRSRKGQIKASLSLQHFLGFESGFTLDKESNTVAIICQDITVVLAFETRERLIAWQVKVGGQLDSSKEFLVMIVGEGSKKLPAGPARMHLQGRRFALTSGVPPRLLGLWELVHLRRYGVVEGRFCFEGGSQCGKGEGLHMLITEKAQDIADAFDIAAQGTLQRTQAASKNNSGNKTRPSTQLSDFNSTEQSILNTASALQEENSFGQDTAGVSSYPSSDERRLNDDKVKIGARPPWTEADHVTLERCNNCLKKLGAISRSSTLALTPGTSFHAGWYMEAVPESSYENSSNSTEYLALEAIEKSFEACKSNNKPPERPSKPARLRQKKPPAPLPVQVCSCTLKNNYPTNNPKIGPYANYDVPKTEHTETNPSENYDTPKQIKETLADDFFKVTNSSAPASLVLKKNCGCVLKFSSKKKPVLVECYENIQPVECPCHKVTNWAHNLISLPYCKRTNEHANTKVLPHEKAEEMALYATIDVSKKTKRQSAACTDKENTKGCPNEPQFTYYKNIEPKEIEKTEGPGANYENLEFAIYLEYYENAKDLLKKLGVTQNEFDALSANIQTLKQGAVNSVPKKSKLCTKCGHSQNALKTPDLNKNRNEEYLLMKPTNERKHEFCTKIMGSNPGYTPMSPNPNWSQSLKHSMHKNGVEIEKPLSIPTSNGNESRISISETANNNREAMQKCLSVDDSARLLEDSKECNSSIGSHTKSSSLETLRNLTIENRRTSSPCENELEHYDCYKSSGSENKTSEESCSKEITSSLGKKPMRNAQIKRSSSFSCKSDGNRDSSTSNDSGVLSYSMKHGGPDFNKMPLTSEYSRDYYTVHKRMRENLYGFVHFPLPRKSKSSDPLRVMSMQLHKAAVTAKSSSAEAEVPVIHPKQLKGVMDKHSSSSGTSNMSDYIETLSMTSSHSSSDTPMRRKLSLSRPTSTLRPRSGKEYHNMDPIITSMYKNGKDLANYTNIP